MALNIKLYFIPTQKVAISTISVLQKFVMRSVIGKRCTGEIVVTCKI